MPGLLCVLIWTLGQLGAFGLQTSKILQVYTRLVDQNYILINAIPRSLFIETLYLHILLINKQKADARKFNL